jgi:Uma2 family endonuclease
MLNPDRITYADFIAFAEKYEGKAEFVDGQIIAQARPTKRHQRLAEALLHALADHVRARGCDALPDTALALSDDTDEERSPDITVTCDKGDLSDEEVRTIRRPSLVIEILSETTAGDDLGKKLLQYQAIPSIQEYLVLDSRKRWVVPHVRDAQGLFVAPRDYVAGLVFLASIELSLNIDALYERARIG